MKVSHYVNFEQQFEIGRWNNIAMIIND